MRIIESRVRIIIIIDNIKYGKRLISVAQWRFSVVNCSTIECASEND